VRAVDRDTCGDAERVAAREAGLAAAGRQLDRERAPVFLARRLLAVVAVRVRVVGIGGTPCDRTERAKEEEEENGGREGAQVHAPEYGVERESFPSLARFSHDPSGSNRAGGCHPPNADSRASATAIVRWSAPRRPRTWIPRGSPRA